MAIFRGYLVLHIEDWFKVRWSGYCTVILLEAQCFRDCKTNDLLKIILLFTGAQWLLQNNDWVSTGNAVGKYFLKFSHLGKPFNSFYPSLMIWLSECGPWSPKTVEIIRISYSYVFWYIKFNWWFPQFLCIHASSHVEKYVFSCSIMDDPWSWETNLG